MSAPRPGKPLVDEHSAYVVAVDQNPCEGAAVLVLAISEDLNALAVRQLGEPALGLLCHLDLLGTLSLDLRSVQAEDAHALRTMFHADQETVPSQTRNCCGWHVAAQRYTAITIWLVILC